MTHLFLVAVFSGPETAQLARQKFQERGIETHRLRISAQSVLHVQVVPTEIDSLALALRSAGALQVTAVTLAADPGWMSHICGHILGAEVMPGAGDSEAGAPNEPFA